MIVQPLSGRKVLSSKLQTLSCQFHTGRFPHLFGLGVAQLAVRSMHRSLSVLEARHGAVGLDLPFLGLFSGVPLTSTQFALRFLSIVLEFA